jgi:hypothetical protein
VVSIANGQKHIAAGKHHASAVVVPILGICIRREDPLTICEPVTAQSHPVDDRRASRRIAFGIRDVDPAVRSVSGMEHDVVNTRIAAGEHRRDAVQPHGRLALHVHDIDGTNGALRDQRTAVRQERNG